MKIRRLLLYPTALAVGVAACGGDGSGRLTDPDDDTPTLETVTISPSQASAAAIGATVAFGATARDGDGQIMTDVTFSWSSTDGSVATVAADGTATAEGDGTAEIVVSASGRADTAAIQVQQAVDSIQVAPESVTVPAGDTAQLAATPVDANGHTVSAAQVSWSSSNSSVATVDEDGTVTGESGGTATVTASAAGRSDEVDVTVEESGDSGNQPPTVEIQSPSEGATFEAGESVQFQGSGDDPEDGALAGADLVWYSNLAGQIGTGSSFSTSGLSEGQHTVTLTGTDSDGLSASASVGIEVLATANLVVSQLRLYRRGMLTSSSVQADPVIRNAGDTEAAGFDWEITVDGTIAAQGRAGPLVGGDSAVVGAQGLGTVTAGEHEVIIWLDTGDEVNEGNESDNSWSDRVVAYPGGFDIELDYLTSVDADHQSAFENAEARWESMVTGDLPDITFSSPENFDFCASGAGNRSATIDDLLIYVRVDSIDGEGGTLGQAGPCAARTASDDSFLTSAVGGMVFDEADLEALADQGLLESTILHEMGHVLGIGTLWSSHGLLVGGGTGDPYFVGAAGRDGFEQIGGDSYAGIPVPVANTGGSGTRDAHWRESVLDRELMTGYLNGGTTNPLSVLTVESLGDQYYSVDPGAADSYQIPGAALRWSTGTGIPLRNDLLQVPVRAVEPSGRMRRPEMR